MYMFLICKFLKTNSEDNIELPAGLTRLRFFDSDFILEVTSRLADFAVICATRKEIWSVERHGIELIRDSKRLTRG